MMSSIEWLNLKWIFLQRLRPASMESLMCDTKLVLIKPSHSVPLCGDAHRLAERRILKDKAPNEIADS